MVTAAANPHVKQVAFEAMIREVKITADDSNDKTLKIVIKTNADDDDMIDKLNRLHRGDETVFVVIQENPQFRKKTKDERQ